MAYAVLPPERWSLLRHKIGLTRQRWSSPLMPRIRGNTATTVYSEHVLDLYKPDAIKLLEECFRIVQPRGILQMGAAYIQAYASG
jgi:predicted SAM-dependent methyltransferase